MPHSLLHLLNCLLIRLSMLSLFYSPILSYSLLASLSSYFFLLSHLFICPLSYYPLLSILLLSFSLLLISPLLSISLLSFSLLSSPLLLALFSCKCINVETAVKPSYPDQRITALSVPFCLYCPWLQIFVRQFFTTIVNLFFTAFFILKKHDSR